MMIDRKDKRYVSCPVGGILATGLIGIRFVDSFIESVSVLLRKWRERWKRHLE